MRRAWPIWAWLALGCADPEPGRDPVTDDAAADAQLAMDGESTDVSRDGGPPNQPDAVYAPPNATPRPDAAVDAGDTDRADASEPECRRALDCLDANPCTDSVCEDGVCQFPANDAACSDGVYCNGLETCRDGACQPSEPPCPADALCSEARRSCDECLTDDDCAPPRLEPTAACMFDGICAVEGNQPQEAVFTACLNGGCSERRMPADPAPCVRDLGGPVECAPDVFCADGVCPVDYSVSVDIRGVDTPEARLVARCVATDTTCVVAGNRDEHLMPGRCVMDCPSGSRVEVCCSNGSDPCGGPPAPARADRVLDDFRSRGFAGGDCPEEDGTVLVECAGVIGESDVHLDCGFAPAP